MIAPPALEPTVILAMPVGPPYGGMTTYTAMLRASALFDGGRAHLFDTTPPAGPRAVRRRLVHSLRNALRLFREVRRRRADVVCFMTSGYTGFYEKGLLALGCRALGARTVLHPVGSIRNFWGHARLGRPLIRFLLERASAVIAVEEDAMAFVRQIAPRSTVWHIPNPVDCEAYGALTRPTREVPAVQVLYAGALVRDKGVLDLLDAVERNRDRLAGARFVLIGGGELLEACRERVRARGLEPLVSIRGYVDEAEKRELLATSDVFCLPSYTEGMPISVLEAMSAGMAVVATRVGGIPFAVEDGRQGLLVEAGDVEGLGRALVSLVHDQVTRRRMAESGFLRVRQRYDIRIVADQFIRRFNMLARRSNHGVR